ncbi:MAG: thioredoxin family protein [Ignavibacteria bacterium]
MKRKIEIFTAGCPICEEQVQKIRKETCDSCEVEVLNVREDKSALEKSKNYNIISLPSVVINGVLADCCSNKGINIETLRSLGIGSSIL